MSRLEIKIKKLDRKVNDAMGKVDEFLATLTGTLPDGWGAQIAPDGSVEYYNENPDLDFDEVLNTYTLNEMLLQVAE